MPQHIAVRLCGLALVALLALSPPPAYSRTALRQSPERAFVLGLTPQGRPVEVVQFGDGPRKLVVVGNTHGGPEANTYRLVNELIDHFHANPTQVPTSVRLFFIPSLNPDGLALGSRFDAAGVDLNRNMNTNLDACPENDWRPSVQGARGLVSDTGGPYADSQTETRLIRAFLLDAAGAIFIHSNAGLVFPATCQHDPSIALAATYAAAAGYTYSRFWSNYTITGGMHDWAGSLGIASITPELVTGDQEELPQNLAGLRAVLADAEGLLPLPATGQILDENIPAAIFRYWRAFGGAELFGSPLAPAHETPTGLSQTFRKVRLALRDDQRDTVYYVQPEPLGRDAARSLAYGGAEAFAPVASTPDGRFFPETGHTLQGAMLDFWQRGGGLEVFGLPLTEPFTAIAADGQRRSVQYLERAVLAYYPEDGGVRLEPLGERELALAALDAPSAQQSVR